MGCHPSHWLMFFRGVGQPPTRLVNHQTLMVSVVSGIMPLFLTIISRKKLTQCQMIALCPHILSVYSISMNFPIKVQMIPSLINKPPVVTIFHRKNTQCCLVLHSSSNSTTSKLIHWSHLRTIYRNPLYCEKRKRMFSYRFSQNQSMKYRKIQFGLH